MFNMGKEHWMAVKRVLCYLRSTSNFELYYESMKSSKGQLASELKCFVNADQRYDINSRMPTSGYVVSLFGGAVSWMSKRQSMIALSTTKVEYMALTHAAKKVIQMRRLCKELCFTQRGVNIGCDNQSALFLVKNTRFHARTKHIIIYYHFIREKVEHKLVVLEKIDTHVNNAYFFY